MTIDEEIKRAEELAEELERAAKEWHENQIRKCELLPFTEMDYTHENDCNERASEYRQLSEWLKELKQLRKLSGSRWIPVSERLPEKICSYLVTLEYEACKKGVTKLWWYGEDGWKPRFSGVVVAWMPLPEAYNAESEEK